MNIGDQHAEEKCNNLRFAEDVALIASSKEQLKRIFKEIYIVFKKVGIFIHDKIILKVEHYTYHHNREVMSRVRDR